jgi:hypothetical protein
MKKISVSVNEKNWQSALNKSRKKPSHLVDMLIALYIGKKERGQEAGEV